MKEPTEDRILTMLVERGHLSAETVERLQAEFETAATVSKASTDDHQSLIEGLVSKALVSPEVIVDLQRELSQGEDDEIDPDDSFPVDGLDRFDCLGLLGAGGMGQVFKALDRELGRTVAIKFFHSTDSKLRQRFATEARAQAKVKHANVCEVYDVGEIDGQQFIVMQFIDGGSLREVASDLTLERRVRLVRDVALAVHAAHRTGLVHRDLKPGNIMVSLVGDDSPTPYVVDFGIARDVAGPQMTVTGDLLGSPSFMAPEQARGGMTIDRRTDVYGLGATLYSVLTGRPPQQGETAFDTLMKVQLDDPCPPRKIDESIPIDLESIALKALEKDQSRRYQSAQDLADDLDRFLDGSPVLARPVGLGRRVIKWARRHRALAASLLVLFLTVGAATAYGMRAAAQAREVQRLTLLFGTEAQRLDAMMRVAHLLPLHDIGPDRQRIRARMEWIREQQRGVRGRAKAPGWYALGRGHLVLGEHEAARLMLHDAWESGFRSPDVAYAYGLTLGQLYDDEASSLGAIRDKQERDLHRDRIRRELRDPAIELLEAATDVEGVAPAYVQGLLASYEGDYQQAIDLAEETLATTPFQYEAWLLKGESALSLVGRSRDRGDQDAAEAAIATAEDAFNEAARLARSDPRPYSRLCTLWGMVMGMRLYGGGGDLETPLQRALVACDQTLIADPQRKQERHNKAICYRQMAEFAIRNGEDPTAYLELGRESNQEILEFDPEDAAAHINLADSYAVAVSWWTGLDERDRPVPAEVALEWSRRGVQSGLDAVEIEPDAVAGYRALGTSSMMRTELLMAAQADPTETMVVAESAFERAEALDPTSVVVINNHAWALYQRAQYQMVSGGDPLPVLNSCITAAERAIELKPNHITALNVLGRAQLMKARALRTDAMDPTAALDAAQRTFETMIEVNPGVSTGHVGQVSVLAERALHAIADGQDPSVLISDGLSAAETTNRNVAAQKSLRWDYAVLKLLAAERSRSGMARHRLAVEAGSLLDDIAASGRLPEWEDRRDLARTLAAG